jgi:hypothetical protein
VRLEGLGPLKDPVKQSGIENLDLPACSVVSQTTTYPRVPIKMYYNAISVTGLGGL